MKYTTNHQIFIGVFIGLLIGLFVKLNPYGSGSGSIIYVANLIADIFVSSLKMVLIPIIFFSISLGIANLSGHKQSSRIWFLTFSFFFISMALAIILGLGSMNLFEPGRGMSLSIFSEQLNNFHLTSIPLSEFIKQFLSGILVNPFKAMTEGNILGVITFSVLVGFAIAKGGKEFFEVKKMFNGLLGITMKIVSWIVNFSPYGISALIIQLVSQQSPDLFITLSKFIIVIIGMTLFHGIVILPLLLYFFTKINLFILWQGAREAIMTAFATSSSSATIPITLRVVEKNLKVRSDIAGFVIPIGATMNMDGTALYEASAALFIANLSGIDLGIGQQIIVFFTAMIGAIGAPGIPSAGMVTIAIVLQSVGLPLEALAILLPIDRLLDTFRTAVNVEGDIVVSLIVQKLVRKN
ncbi:MAG: dicarboxylate/amino acid:cation symporter [Betaproteobacteria bacterium]|nr:dicarboxylate/amino acid:cation symporter [Betaproteobacteria bacterium]